MRRRWLLLCCMMLVPVAVSASVTVLTYHDIVDQPGPDRFAVSVGQFEQQMAYLAANGYQPISLIRFYSSASDRQQLPAKPVILTFDDGLLSYQEKVIPILQKYHFPSVLSIVSSWADGSNQPEEYRGKLLDWEAIQRLDRSPLVEVISHSHDLHHWVQSSPRGTSAPVAVTRLYLADRNRYETEAEFEQRISADLQQTQSRFRSMLGRPALAITWPYGQYDAITSRLAGRAGFKLQLTLEDGAATAGEFPRVRRNILLAEHSLKEFQAMLCRTYKIEGELRFVELDLDLFSHVSADNHPRLIEQMVNRLGSLGINTVVVTPFTRDGKRAFFPNKQLPMESDLLSAVLDRIQTRLGIGQVYLRFPAGKETLPDLFYRNLARRIRFNAALFDIVPDSGQLKSIRRSLQEYLPEIRLGSWKNVHTGMDLSFISQAQLQPNDGENKSLFVFVSSDDYLTTGGLADTLRSLREKGVRNYGYGPLNYLAGAHAPDQLIEAMAYRVRKGP